MFKDELFQAQWLRTTGCAIYGGAELGECLAIARRIREPDSESWYVAWAEVAERLQALGDQCLTRGRLESAKSAYLRAFNYWRASYTFLIGAPVDPRVVMAYRRQRDSFQAAAALMACRVERIEIPYEGQRLRGYLLRGAGTAGPRPTLIINGGYDSPAEEGYFFSGAAAVARGYTCILFDGPGQGGALIEDGLVFRPDWEAVIRPVVDYAITRAEVDPKRIALLGCSFGGYLASRGASGEPRLAALIADPGQASLEDEFKSRMPPFIADRALSRAPWIAWPLAMVLHRRLRHPTAGWALRRALWVHGLPGPVAYLRLTPQYSVKDQAGQIACPALICSAEDDEIGATAQDLFDRLRSPKSFHTFSSHDGAGAHCESGAREVFNQVAFDWLGEVLSVNPN